MSANDVPPTASENSHWHGLSQRVTSGSKPTHGDDCENSVPKVPSNPESDDLIFQKISKCLERIQAATSKEEKRPRFELDTFARIIFPVSFVLFNVIYWSIWPIQT